MQSAKEDTLCGVLATSGKRWAPAPCGGSQRSVAVAVGCTRRQPAPSTSHQGDVINSAECGAPDLPKPKLTPPRPVTEAHGRQEGHRRAGDDRS